MTITDTYEVIKSIPLDGGRISVERTFDGPDKDGNRQLWVRLVVIVDTGGGTQSRSYFFGPTADGGWVSDLKRIGIGLIEAAGMLSSVENENKNM